MWKLIIVAVLFVNLGVAQRSFYAPRSGSYPKLLARFKTNETASDAKKVLENRNEPEDFDFYNLSPQMGLQEKKFFERVSKWPRERQPFWFKNINAISSARGVNVNGENAGRATTTTTENATQNFRRPSPAEQPLDRGLGTGLDCGGAINFPINERPSE